MERKELLKSLFENDFDLLIIGGGATGAGIALDASLRGYKTALIEASDFSSGASSCSTKLLHGGVRYLEKAFLHLDRKQLKLVKGSLQERATLMRIAPHLTNEVTIILPVQGMFQKIYYWLGLQAYEMLSGARRLGACRWLSADDVRQSIPGMASKNLKGGISYVDGQFDDARFNIALVQTAVQSGGVALNYVEHLSFVKADGKISGVIAQDRQTGAVGEVRAKVVVNATGSMSDRIRRLDNATASPLLAASRGSHLVFEQETLPLKEGFLIPATSDGRVIFGLPWQGKVIVGTTDVYCEPDPCPKPSEEEVSFLLEHLQDYFSTPIRRSDIIAAWSGIRPLCRGKDGVSSSDLSRDHFIEKSQSGLYSIVGGKWTTYRLMAKDLLDKVIDDKALPARNECTTEEKLLVGAEKYSEELHKELSAQGNLPLDIGLHLARAYGGNAWKVLGYAKQGLSGRLQEKYPFIEAEVPYCLHEELAISAEDLLYRRFRLGFLDEKVAGMVAKRIDEIIKLC